MRAIPDDPEAAVRNLVGRNRSLPSLRAILAFEATARNLSISRAAEELNLTTSAVSHRIGGLEDQLGVKLFRRTRNGVLLTWEGQRILKGVESALDHLSSTFSTGSRGGPRRLIVSVLPALASRWLLPRLGELLAFAPDIRFELQVRNDLVDFDIDRSADVAIRFGFGEWPGVDCVRLTHEAVTPVASPAYRSGVLPSAPEQLLDCDLIGNSFQPWQDWFDAQGLDWDDNLLAVEIDDSSLAIEAAIQGLGVTLARLQLVNPEIAAGRLVRLFPDELPTPFSYWLVWPKGTRKSALIARLREWLQQEFGSGPG